LRSSPLIPIFLIVVVDVLALTLMLPLLPFYAERLGATPTEATALVTTFALCQLVAGPMLGSWSDRIGRRPVLLVSQIGTLAGLLLLAWAPALWVVFLSRAIDGLTAGNLTIAQAYIADVSKPEERAKSFALIGIAFGLGFLVGPAISGFLSQYGYVWPVFAACGLSFITICSTYFMLPESPRHRGADSSRKLSVLAWGQYGDYFARPSLGPLLYKFFAYIFAFGFFMSGFALYAERRYTWNGHPFGPKEVGYLFAYVGLFGGAIQGSMGALVRRFGERRLLSIGFILSVVAYTVLGFASTFALLMIAITVSIPGGVIRPVITSLITQNASSGEQGVVLGLTQSLNSVAQIVAPLLSGFVIQRGWLMQWGFAVAAISLVGLLIPMPERRPAETAI
jgi:MFS family permease